MTVTKVTRKIILCAYNTLYYQKDSAVVPSCEKGGLYIGGSNKTAPPYSVKRDTIFSRLFCTRIAE